MQIQILTTQVTTQTTKTGKPYQQLEVNFKNLTFGKVESKKLMPFGTNEAAFKVLSGAKQGDVFEISVSKNSAGYNDWTEVKQQAPGVVVGEANNKGSTAVQVKSTYETPEERAKKQVYIVRQSSISSAIETLKQDKKALLPEEVLQLASKYYSWVMQSPEDVIKQDVFTLPNEFPDVE